MNNNDEFYMVEQLPPRNTDTVFHIIKRKKDGVSLDLHITNSAYQVVEVNKDINEFLAEQIEFGKRFIELMNTNYEIIIEARDVENNLLKPLDENQLKQKILDRR